MRGGASRGRAGTVFDSVIIDRPIAGSWLMPVAAGVTTFPADTALTGCWIFVPYTTPVDRIGCEVTTAGAAGDTAAFSLYRKVPGQPTLNRVLTETAALSVAATGFVEATIALTLPPGRYAAMWRSVVKTGAAAIRGRTGMYHGLYAPDTAELTNDQRGGIHPGQIGSGTSAPASLTLTLGSRTHTPLIYLRAA